MTGVTELVLHGEGPAATNVELAVFFVAGLLGGAHCLGMCGPLVTMYSEKLQDQQSSRREGLLTMYEVRQHALFNVGRTISYATIGGIAGLAGALLFDASDLVGQLGTWVRVVSGLVVGSAIIFVGLQYLRNQQLSHSVLGSGPLGSIYTRLAARIDGWVTGPGMIGLGLVHGLLPCPILYPAFLYAFTRGSPEAGVLGLAALGVGTFPTLFLYGTVIQSVSATHRARLHRVLGVVFLVMGWMPIAHGLALLGIHVPHVEIPIYQL
jgi:hypothetical protein